MRLDKMLTNMQICTRSEAKQLARKGRITVNGNAVKNTNYKLTIENGKLIDTVMVDSKVISYTEFEYYMLNKPAGVVSATVDDNFKTVIDLISSTRKDLFPVGRLDKDTEGLLIITNDGQFAHNLLSPTKHVNKRYFATIEGEVKEEHIKQFKDGLDIYDKRAEGQELHLKPADLTILNTYVKDNVLYSDVYVTISEGKYHQVKRMFESINMSVEYLKRLQMASLILDETLELGDSRELSVEEVQLLEKV